MVKLIAVPKLNGPQRMTALMFYEVVKSKLAIYQSAQSSARSDSPGLQALLMLRQS